MVDIRFEELPGAEKAARRPNGEHAQIAAELKARPEQWAHIGTQSSARSAGSLAYAIRHGRMNAYLPAGAFEATARTVGGEHRLYARFVGAQADE